MWLRQFLVPLWLAYHRMVSSINWQTTSTFIIFHRCYRFDLWAGLMKSRRENWFFFPFGFEFKCLRFKSIYNCLFWWHKCSFSVHHKKSELFLENASKGYLNKQTKNNRNCSNKKMNRPKRKKSAHSFGRCFHWIDIIPESELTHKKTTRLGAHVHIFMKR